MAVNYFMITVKYVYGPAEAVDRTDYARWMCHAHDIHSSLDFAEVEYEKDQHNREHLHILCITPLKRLYKKKLQKFGFNIDIQQLSVTDIQRWRTYIQKDQYIEYMFRDE